MKYLLAGVGMAVAAGVVLVAVQAPQSAALMDAEQAVAPLIQNGRVEVRRGAAIGATVATVAAATAGAAADPVWIGWHVPMVPGDRDVCSWYGDWSGTVRGAFLDAPGLASGGSRPAAASPAGPARLEAGTGLLVLVRVARGASERVRSLGDDCPIDAGGRQVIVLDGITPADSVRYLERFVTSDAAARMSQDARQRLGQGALSAIAFHADATADTALDRVATDADISAWRRQATDLLGRYRGARGLAVLDRLVAAERDPDTRRQLVTSLGQSREAGAVDALRRLSADADPGVRAEAVYWFAQRGGAAVVPEVLEIIQSEADSSVRRRAVSGLARLPDNEGVPHLLTLARSSTDPLVRREAVSGLTQSRDPRALAYFEEILRR